MESHCPLFVKLMMEGKTEIWERRRLNLSDPLLRFYLQNELKKQNAD